MVPFSLIGALVFGAGGLSVGLLGRFAPRARAGDARGPGLAPPILSLGAAAAVSWMTGLLPWLALPALVLAGLLLLCAALRSRYLNGLLVALAAHSREARWQWTTLAVGCPLVALAVVAVRPPTGSTEGPWKEESLGIAPPPTRHLPQGTAVTDQGHDIPLWEAGNNPVSPRALDAAEDATLRQYNLMGRVIRVAAADPSINCHGWTFTGGHYLLPDDAIEPILHENGYRRVEKPGVGDLIIYRNDHGEVCHSGVVWSVADGLVLVKSKWAWIGCYLHAPESSPFGEQWSFYHSDRFGGHRLHGLESPADGTYSERSGH